MFSSECFFLPENSKLMFTKDALSIAHPKHVLIILFYRQQIKVIFFEATDLNGQLADRNGETSKCGLNCIVRCLWPFIQTQVLAGPRATQLARCFSTLTSSLSRWICTCVTQLHTTASQPLHTAMCNVCQHKLEPLRSDPPLVSNAHHSCTTFECGCVKMWGESRSFGFASENF